MSEGFTEAYNDTQSMQGTARDDTECRSEITDKADDKGNYGVVVYFEGPKADLFARTFDSAVRASGGNNVKRVVLLSEITNENTDRAVTFSVPEESAQIFLDKFEKIKNAVIQHKSVLSRLYDIGINAQNNVNIGLSGIATKYFVFLEDIENERPEYALEIQTNHPHLINALKDNEHIRQRPIPLNVNGRDYEEGQRIQALDMEGNIAIEDAIRKIVTDRNIGGMSKL